MANVNAPFGFRPTMRTLMGGNGSIIPAHKLVGAAALYIQDAVTQAASGTKTTRAIAIAANPGTGAVLGVNLVYGANATATDHAVVMAAGALFIVQGDGAAVGLTVDKLSYNANILFQAGNTGTKISKQALKEDTVAVTAGFDVHVRGLYRSPDNVAGQYARVYCSFNNLVDADQKVGI